MPLISDISSLQAYDSDVENPLDEWTLEQISQREDCIASVLQNVSKLARIAFAPEGSEEFQDGPVFMCAQEYGVVSGVIKNDVLSGLYFSKFSDLVTGERFDERSQISTDDWNNVVNLLSEKYAFNFVKPQILTYKYNGLLSCADNATWQWRFFGAWY